MLRTMASMIMMTRMELEMMLVLVIMLTIAATTTKSVIFAVPVSAKTTMESNESDDGEGNGGDEKMSPRSRSARGMIVEIVTMTLMATRSSAKMATHDCLRLTDDGGRRLK